MTKNVIMIVCLLPFLSGTIYGQTKKVGKTVDGDKSIKWEEFYKSTVSKDSIDYAHLQGLWKAYKGVYLFGDVINVMSLTTPAIVEVKDQTYRRNNDSEFEKFILDKNFIINERVKSDTGLINKITSKELIISWKTGKNYTRYYYKK